MPPFQLKSIPANQKKRGSCQHLMECRRRRNGIKCRHY